MSSVDIPGFKEWIIELKQRHFNLESLPEEFSIHIEEVQVCWILPFSANDLSEDTRISMLVDWRNENRQNFISNEEVDFNRTSRWLREQVLDNPNRELFWVLSEDKKFIGHVGILYDDENLRFEFDSILRGVVSTTGLMWLVMRIVENMIHTKFNAFQIFLRVLGSNQKAISFYHRNGFQELASTESAFHLQESRRVIFMVKDITT